MRTANAAGYHDSARRNPLVPDVTDCYEGIIFPKRIHILDPFSRAGAADLIPFAFQRAPSVLQIPPARFWMAGEVCRSAGADLIFFYVEPLPYLAFHCPCFQNDGINPYAEFFGCRAMSAAKPVIGAARGVSSDLDGLADLRASRRSGGILRFSTTNGRRSPHLPNLLIGQLADRPDCKTAQPREHPQRYSVLALAQQPPQPPWPFARVPGERPSHLDPCIPGFAEIFFP